MNNISWLNLGTYTAIVVYPIRFLVGVFFAVVVFRNGMRREALEYRIPPIVWSAIVLVDPVFGLLAYWFINRDAPYREIADDEV